MNLNDIDVGNSIHENFLSETLISFDQILKITTIDTWLFQKERNKQTTAAQNLKAKMASIRTTQATEITAQAIARATESLDLMKSKDLSTNLRISNLEKQIRKQEQKINEKFKSSQKNKTEEEKNFNGSYTTGSVASPEKQTPPKPQKQTTKKSIRNNRSLQRKHRLQRIQVTKNKESRCISMSQTYNKATEKARRSNTALYKKRKNGTLEGRGAKQRHLATKESLYRFDVSDQPSAIAYHAPTKQLSWWSTNLPCSSFTFQSTITQPLQHSTREQQSPYPEQYLLTHAATSLEPQRQPKLTAQYFNCMPSTEFNERKPFRDKIQLNNTNKSTFRQLARRRSKRYMKSNELKSELERHRIANQAKHFTTIRCLSNYGFCANSAHTIQKNFNSNIQKVPLEPSITFVLLTNSHPEPDSSWDLI